MAPLHRVYFLGNLIRDPEVRYAPNGTAVARCGLAVPTHSRHGDTWQDDVCRIDVVVFGRSAERVRASLRQGQGVLIEGHVQWRQAQEGPSRCPPEVIAERIQVLPRPREGGLAGAGVGRSPRGERPAAGPSAGDTRPGAGRGEGCGARGVRHTARV